MKKRMILAFAALLVFGLSVATFAYKQTTITSTAMSCCCHSDSCPMKSKDASGKEAASCCDNCDCCKGDSCPMKKKDASGKETSSCDNCDCCKGDSKTTPKTVAYYFKGQPLYTKAESGRKCC